MIARRLQSTPYGEAKMRRERGAIASNRCGVVITAVEPGSVADEAGLQAGDIIHEINRHPIQNLADYKKATEGTARDKTVSS